MSSPARTIQIVLTAALSKLYDPTKERLTQAEVERIRL
jgi:hypothetical protein